VHAISPGPLATRAASDIPEFDTLLDKAKKKAPARSLVSIDDVGVATAFLAHDAARLITGETLYVDGGYQSLTKRSIGFAGTGGRAPGNDEAAHSPRRVAAKGSWYW
jgi:enoyl-[acyl-carrier-protein] reductase (NADH)